VHDVDDAARRAEDRDASGSTEMNASRVVSDRSASLAKQIAATSQSGDAAIR
jgi:hypothetical protein